MFFFGVLVEFIKERNFHGNLTGFSCWMLDVGCWVMHGFNVDVMVALFFGIQSEFCWGPTGIPDDSQRGCWGIS